DALNLLHKRITVNYGSGSAGSRNVEEEDELVMKFFVDLFIVVGVLMKLLTKPGPSLSVFRTLQFSL
ncbi:hypothetical protein CC80DRAFT_425358, partial [Byssothecium circinans]